MYPSVRVGEMPLNEWHVSVVLHDFLGSIQEATAEPEEMSRWEEPVGDST